jgi:hypothetical protein
LHHPKGLLLKSFAPAEGLIEPYPSEEFFPTPLHFHPAPIESLYTPPGNHGTERSEKRMENVGYILMDRSRVLDGDGNEEEVLSLSLRGRRFGIRAREMEALLGGGDPARVERLRRNWRFYLDGVEGVAELSRSGKAVNIGLSGSEWYTVSLRALRSVLSGESRYAMVAGVPGDRVRATPRRGPATYQLRIPVTASS